MTVDRVAIWWNELMTRDVEAAMNYYERVAGWTWNELASESDFGQYHLALSDGRPVAGCVDITGVDAFDHLPPFWLTFVKVEDCDLATEWTRDCGGQVLRAPRSLRNIGRVSIVVDAGGATHGLITPVAAN